MYDINDELIGYRSIRVNITDAKQLSKVNSILKDDLSLKFNEIKTKDRMQVDESKIEFMGKLLDAFSNEWKKPISNLSLKILDLKIRLDKDAQSKEYLYKLVDESNEFIKDLSINLNQFKSIFNYKNINDKYNVYNEVENALTSLNNRDMQIILEGNKTLFTYGIANDFRRIILSLLNNSLEAFQDKSIDGGKIVITVYSENDAILIKFEDNAQGIPEDIIKKIFEPDFSTKLEKKTKGLTLYISQLMLQKNGGDMWAENIENGSCFYIKLISKDRRKEIK